MPHERARHDDVGDVIDDVVEVGAVEEGGRTVDVGQAGEHAVGGVDERRDGEPQQRATIIGLEDRDQRQPATDDAARGVSVDEIAGDRPQHPEPRALEP